MKCLISLVDLDANDEQLDFKIVYASGRNGYAKLSLDDESSDIRPLLDAIIQFVPKPCYDAEFPLQMQIASLDYNDYVGRIGIGRIFPAQLPPASKLLELIRQENNPCIKLLICLRLWGYQGKKRCWQWLEHHSINGN